MTSIVLLANNVTLLKRWHSYLNDYRAYVTQDQNELFDYFDLYTKPIILVVESVICSEDNFRLLKIIKDKYLHVKVVVLSHYPTVKEAQKLIPLQIKAYGNSYMYKIHFQDIIKEISNGKWWFYPDFLISMNIQKNIKYPKIQATIKSLSHLVIVKNSEEERIVDRGEKIKEYDIITTPYADSGVIIDINDDEYITLNGFDTLYYEKSVFVKNSFDDNVILNIDDINNILEFLGEEILQEEKQTKCNKYNFTLEQPLTAKNIYKNSCKAIYQGLFNEYTFSISNTFKDHIIINDEVPKRDGSDILNKNTKLIIFKDKTIHFDDIWEQLSK